ncbi:hypothetical protein LCGC14_2464420, partial [marine sediment metagenome]
MAKQLLKLKCSNSKCALREDVYSGSMQWITVVMTVLCVVFLFSGTVRADNPFDSGSYPVGWWTTMDPNSVVDVYYAGGNTILAYWGSAAPSSRHQFLNEAAAGDIRVIMEVDPVLIANGDAAGIRNLVSTYDDYPAVAGWSTGDEPYWMGGLTLSKMQIAYDAIKMESTKPVVICFSEPAVERGIPYDWRSAYDQFLIDSYPARVGEAEFSRLDTKWKLDMQNALSQSLLADRPWWSVMQGWGKAVGEETSDHRLPTFNETRFMNYYSLSKDATGLLQYVYYRNKLTPAQPDEAYPYDGPTWFDEVWTPLAAEINTIGMSLQNGKLSGAASDDTPDVRTDVYYDPDTGKYYMVAMNETTGSETTTFTVDLDPPGEKLILATPLFEGARPVIPFVGTQFSDEFSDYEVHVYELMTMLLGDANGDGVVSADDYAS